jgi:hypothetical protein
MDYPNFVCHECGTKHGSWYFDGKYKGPKHHSATYHMGTCDACGKEDIPVTEPRDYGHFPNWQIKNIKPTNSCELIEYLLDDFPFDNVLIAMNALDWKWIQADNTLKIPNVQQLRKSAGNLLTKALNDKNHKIFYSGGFWAESADNGLILRFILSEREIYLDDFDG